MAIKLNGRNRYKLMIAMLSLESNSRLKKQGLLGFTVDACKYLLTSTQNEAANRLEELVFFWTRKKSPNT